jgi:translation initiation factor 2 beta subunit (eIF-2beta)/eIF-5
MKVPFPNTERTSFDPSYRYQRDTLVIDKSGQFFVLKNIVAIAKDLNIKIEDLIKYMQKKIGQSITFDKASNSYKVKNLSNDSDKYIEQYICETLVCNKCQLPEMKDTKICAACGNKK